MTIKCSFLALVSCLALASPAVAGPSVADQSFPLDARVILDSYRALVESRIEGVLGATRTLAATEEARSGDWTRIRGALEALAGSTDVEATVWYARPSGDYFTVLEGATGQSLGDRAYFPTLLAGRDVTGALVVSRSTGQRSLVVASPVLADGKVTGVVGVSLDAALLAASLDRAVRLPADVVFYAIDAQGQTALHRAGELIFAFPSDVGSPTLRDAVRTMLAEPEGVVRYEYAGTDRTALFERSALTGWVFVLGKAHPRPARP